MGNRVWHKVAIAWLCPALLLFAGHAGAVSLEKVEVASHLGEPFFAEVPLKLDSNELASKVFIDIAAPADYKIFEVYRDPVLKAIRADVTSDTRGVRVKLSSRSRIKTPFFNLVLKIRYGRVSHFKKFSVFLDAPKSIQQAATQAPQPSVKAVQTATSSISPPASLTKSAGQIIIPPQPPAVADAVKPSPEYYESWARTDRYGPIIRGDTLSTVAERLRIDFRYTRNQIMLALFEKNNSSFDQNNMNLLKAGAHLNVPTAAEVEQHNKVEATRFLAEQEKKWKELTQQPRYAAEAEAQRTRYTKRISIGEHADGVAAAPVAIAAAVDQVAVARQDEKTQPQSKTAVSETLPSASVDSTVKQTPDLAAQAEQTEQTEASKQAEAAQIEQVILAQTESSQILEELRQQNSLLQEQLVANQKNIEALNRKVGNDVLTAAATKARMEKLEILITRLQSELEKVDQQRSSPLTAGMDWVLWLLIALVVILLGIVAMLMRREPAHPAASVGDEAENVQATEAVEDEALAAVIEQEVAGIETGGVDVPVSKETATIDSLPAFTDELSDTDTAELEPFDADADVEPDPDIDYLSEAEVYIRYGMDEEAIKQLDMALRLQPDNVEAHIKKAELLLGKNDRSELDETIAAATMTLAAVDLDRFKSSIEQLGVETDETDVEPEIQIETRDTAQDTLPLDESAANNLDFDLSDLDVPDIEADKQQGEDEQDSVDDASDQETEEMSWLHDDAFDGDLPQEDESVATEQALTISTDTGASTTQELDSLLSEFSDHENTQVSDHTPESVEINQLNATSTDILPDFDVLGGATQELDHLLTEFSGQDTVETATDEEHGATRHLDQLLSEFDEDEDIDFTSTQGEFDEAVIEQGKSQTEILTGESISMDIDHGATQELDSLLAEFSDADGDQISIGNETDELNASFFEPAENTSQLQDNKISVDTDHGATQELDNLLSEFSNAEEEHLDIDVDQAGLDTENIEDAKAGGEITGDDDLGSGATQVLGRLLDEFNDEDDKKG